MIAEYLKRLLDRYDAFASKGATGTEWTDLGEKFARLARLIDSIAVDAPDRKETVEDLRSFESWCREHATTAADAGGRAP